MTLPTAALIGLCSILFLCCIGLSILYRYCAKDSRRLLWFVENGARMFYQSGFLRWSGLNGFEYEDIDGSGYRAIIDRAMEDDRAMGDTL